MSHWPVRLPMLSYRFLSQSCCSDQCAYPCFLTASHYSHVAVVSASTNAFLRLLITVMLQWPVRLPVISYGFLLQSCCSGQCAYPCFLTASYDSHVALASAPTHAFLRFLITVMSQWPMRLPMLSYGFSLQSCCSDQCAYPCILTDSHYCHVAVVSAPTHAFLRLLITVMSQWSVRLPMISYGFSLQSCCSGQCAYPCFLTASYYSHVAVACAPTNDFLRLLITVMLQWSVRLPMLSYGFL